VKLNLSGKRALVTGSTAGIGEAIVRALSREGVTVAIHGRDAERGLQIVKDLERLGGHAVFIKADLSVPTEVAQLATTARTALGGIDILVNNAAIYPQHTWFDSGAEIWTRMHEVNVMPAVRLIQGLVPEMKDRGWGRVIQISSGEGSKPFAHMPAYGATKAAINNLTVSLCLSIGGSGITVNAISAGLIRTAEVERWFFEEAKARGWTNDWNDVEPNILRSYLPVPVGHIGSPDDIARMTAFLASPQSAYINGAILRVDGGSHAWSA
jgi:3-oxoacyl-[acyl-carrier protein] reductase